MGKGCTWPECNFYFATWQDQQAHLADFHPQYDPTTTQFCLLTDAKERLACAEKLTVPDDTSFLASAGRLFDSEIAAGNLGGEMYSG